jgi:hypothetical protein
MTLSRFEHRIDTEEELRALVGAPSDLVVKKQLHHLDVHARAFIARAPFALLATAGSDGSCDVSPRGDAPGFALVLDDRTLVLPDRPGNRRVDSFRNILQTGGVGLLFVIPGVEETLRVNGEACLVRDPALLERLTAQGKQPQLAVAIEVRECFLHCAKAFKRSKLWQPESWPPAGVVPSLGKMLSDQVQPAGTTVEQLEAHIAESYAKRLY